LLRQCQQAVFTPRRQDEIGASRGQGSRELGAEARARSGDQGYRS
jgi:hypothetical protein